MQRLTILTLFLLSGSAALIYQIVWVRQATLVFGVSIYAYSTVLAAFMGGAALGSYALGNWADRVKSPLRSFALLQICIALLGALAPSALLALMPTYAALARTVAADPVSITAVRTFFSILVLAPPTFLIGATLPLMARAFTRQPGRVGSDVGQLYAADTLGAAVGCALAGLVLLRLLGTQATVFVAVALNAIAAVGAWLLARRPSPQQDASFTQKKPPSRPAQSAKLRPQNPTRLEQIGPGFVLAAYTLSGFAALGYEIVWARILTVFTLDAVFSFAIMLTTFLTGLTLGGWLGAWWTRRQRVTTAHFANVQIAIGLATLLTLFIFAWLPNRVTLETTLGGYSVINGILFEFLLGFLTLLLPTTLLGLLFPLVTSIYTGESTAAVGAGVGRIYAWNTAGAVLGSLIVGFGLIPLLGLQATAASLSVLNLIIGVVASWLPTAHAGSSRLIPQGGLALGIALILLLPARYYLGFRQGATDQMVYYGEGAETTVAVFDVKAENFKVSFVNGRIEVPTDPLSMRAFRLLGHLPALLQPDAERALMLSFGNGIATGSLDTHNIARIDAVDLSAEQ
ncbi:MAG: fused MFS/spermidine synthase, partial [Chloroflexota bacterium]|nr:fused MFS/spermidine synthase [Chloroflexota bacterium]